MAACPMRVVSMPDGVSTGARGRIDAAEAEHAAAVSRVVAVLLRGRFALVSAAIRAADAIDRVQGREHDQYRHCQEPSHDLIIACFPPVRAVEAIFMIPRSWLHAKDDDARSPHRPAECAPEVAGVPSARMVEPVTVP